jgi:hypothetical protein
MERHAFGPQLLTADVSNVVPNSVLVADVSGVGSAAPCEARVWPKREEDGVAIA